MILSKHLIKNYLDNCPTYKSATTCKRLSTAIVDFVNRYSEQDIVLPKRMILGKTTGNFQMPVSYIKRIIIATNKRISKTGLLD